MDMFVAGIFIVLLLTDAMNGEMILNLLQA